MRFFFAWVNATDTTFSGAFEREDEQVFGFSLQHAEGNFASLDIDIKNPHIGLLATGRKQWLWLSCLPDGATDAVPLFFGRLVGVPSALVDTVVRLAFIAKPQDYTAQVAALADTMRVPPFYDPIWLTGADLTNPDLVLEGYSKLWHIDRVTGHVTASDILTGEDGLLVFGEGDAFSDSVSASFSQSPATKVTVDATVRWAQKGTGSIDITPYLLKAFADGTPPGVTTVSGATRTTAGMISIVAGDAMVAAWPKEGANIGGSWSVGVSSAKVVGQPPLDPILVGPLAAYTAVQLWNDFPGNKVALQMLFERSPGFVVDVQDETLAWANPQYGGATLHGAVNILWVPVWRIAAHMEVKYTAIRDRTEQVTFDVVADIQPLFSDPAGSDVALLTLGPADVDGYIEDVRRPRYFSGARGAESFQNLLARARATLLMRARAVDVQFSFPFNKGLDLSCRKSAVLFDHRLPGGNAEGKIKSYSLSADGDSGVLLATAVIACSIGRNGTVEAVRGTPTYVADGYVADGYEVMAGEIIVPIAGEIGYGGLSDYSYSDDGVVLTDVRAGEYIQDLVASGRLQEQQAAATSGGLAATAVAVKDKINGTLTTVSVTMKPISSGPFNTTLEPTVTALKIPRTINLESSDDTEGTA